MRPAEEKVCEIEEEEEEEPKPQRMEEDVVIVQKDSPKPDLDETQKPVESKNMKVVGVSISPLNPHSNMSPRHSAFDVLMYNARRLAANLGTENMDADLGTL